MFRVEGFEGVGFKMQGCGFTGLSGLGFNSWDPKSPKGYRLSRPQQAQVYGQVLTTLKMRTACAFVEP